MVLWVGLHQRWVGGKRGSVYDVTLGDDVILTGSRDPEHDLARALLARGITGLAEVVDGITGKHRTTVKIEAAAERRTSEDRRGLRTRVWTPHPRARMASEGGASKATAPEGTAPVQDTPDDVWGRFSSNRQRNGK